MAARLKKITMWLAWGLLGSGLSIGVIYPQTNAPNAKFTMVLSAEKPAVYLGEDIDVLIKVTNTSNGPLTLTFGHRGNVACCYQYDIRDDQGAPVAKVVRPSPPYPTRMPGEIGDDTLPLGQSVTSSTKISDAYGPFTTLKGPIRIFVSCSLVRYSWEFHQLS